MRIRIYQIKAEQMRKFAFVGLRDLERLQGNRNVHAENYDMVYQGNVDCNNLEEIYSLFNLNHPSDYYSRSLSVSDVVEVVDDTKIVPGFYFCDSSGFAEIDFEVQKAAGYPEKTEIRPVVTNTPKTLIVNLFAGPGAGKSTCAWRLAGELTRQGLRVEYVPEYAKELVWDNRMDLLDGSLEHQRIIFEEQNHRIQRLVGKVDVVVTDSPILFSVLYSNEYSSEFDMAVRTAFSNYNNFNLSINRGNDFDPAGRIQTEAESLAMDDKIQNYLRSHKIFCITYDRDDIERIVGNIHNTYERINAPAPVQNEKSENKKAFKEVLQERGIRPDERIFIEVPPSSRPKLVKYDLDAIGQIPIEEILSDYGVQLQRNHFFKLRDERSASAKYYPETNSWFDFGGGSNKGGGTIQLVMELENVGKSEAIRLLGKRYHIRELTTPAGAERFNWLSNKDFQLIGIDAQNPLRAPKNPYQSYTEEQAARLKEAMNLPTNELLEKNPGQYKAILETVAVPFVKSVRTDYYCVLDSLTTAEKEQAPESLEVTFLKDSAKQAFEEYRKTYATLRSSAYNVRLNVAELKPDFERDLKLARQGRLKIEVGDYPYSEFKKLPGANVYREMSLQHYQLMQEQLHGGQLTVDRPFCAFRQNGRINLVLKEPDKSYFDDLFRGVEYYTQKLYPEILDKAVHGLNRDNMQNGYEIEL